MVRLRRAGREQAIKEAIRRLEAEGRYKMFTRGEICKKMGITSQSKIRDILNNMVDTHQLVSGDTAIDGYNHEITCYGLAAYGQPNLIEDYGTYINGQWVTMSGEAIGHVQHDI